VCVWATKIFIAQFRRGQRQSLLAESAAASDDESARFELNTFSVSRCSALRINRTDATEVGATGCYPILIVSAANADTSIRNLATDRSMSPTLSSINQQTQAINPLRRPMDALLQVVVAVQVGELLGVNHGRA